MAGRLPESIALHLDHGTRRSRDGRALLGGSPLRLLRFTEAGTTAMDRLFGHPGRGPADPTEAAVARRLLDADMAFPRPTVDAVLDGTVSVVIPVRDDGVGLERALDRLAVPGGTDVVVVDDGSADPDEVRRVVAGRGRVVRHDRSLGPGAARNTGWRASTGDVILFLDADVVLRPEALGLLGGHLADPAVGAVAPRVRSDPGVGSVLGRYEAVRSPLDLGSTPARVAPLARVAYVPTAVLLIRRRVLEELDGFDADLFTGEDVDLVWRAVGAGWTVRYEPRVEAIHRPRASWRGLIEQRRGYGRAAAPLDERHPGVVAPVVCNVWTLIAWALAALCGRRGRVAAVVTVTTTTAALVPRMRPHVTDPVATSIRLAGVGTLATGHWLARAVWRAWLPAAAVAAIPSRRFRRVLLAAAVVPAVRDWLRTRPDLDPVRFSIACVVDDAAYAAGVWEGIRRRGSARCLAPRLSGIPGVTDRRTPAA